MSVKLRAIARAFASYRGAALVDRAFVAARYVVAPMGPLADELTGRHGRVLSLGSGLSMLERYLAELNPYLTFEGIDLDPAKVEVIERTRPLSPRVSLGLGDATELSSLKDSGERYEVVLICDAVHHFPADRHAAVLRDAADMLVPGGSVIVKDLDSTPRWKYHWNRIHDRLVAGPEPITCRPPAEMAAMLRDAGLTVERADRIDRRFTPYAHYIVRATKAADAGLGDPGRTGR